MNDIYNTVYDDLLRYQDSEKKEILPRFFKTGKGEYAEGDKFIGVTNPNCRRVAKKYKYITINDVGKLLKSEFHEMRFVALVILIEKYNRGDSTKKQEIYNFYIKNTEHINNWDLVDISCYKIIGKHLLNRDRKLLYSLSNSASLWERRIAIISTFEFIRNNDFIDTLKISIRLLHDEHDLIHKAVGWMLREVGKRNIDLLDEFIEKHYKNIPRTTLRYAIEKHDEDKRKDILNGDF